MSDTVIRVENLGKKYVIGHQKQERYSTLRDGIANGARSLIQRFQKPHKSADREEFWALKDVSFEIKRGDRVGIIGRNGAGKSTLLKILSRITEPTQGQIRIKGRVASLLEVGTGFHPELTGRENIYLNGAILGMSKVEIKKKFDEIVAFAEVERFLDTPVKRYSSGMYVRLAFAVAAHLEPEILVVDEVLAVGDVQFQKKCLGKMEDVGKEGRTVIFVSHNMTAISKLCNQSILLNRGTVTYIGQTNEVIEEYLAVSAKVSGYWQVDPDLKKLEDAILIQARTRKTCGNPSSLFGFQESFKIEVDYRNCLKNPNWVLAIRLTNSFGDDIFTSWNTDNLTATKPFQSKKCRAVCSIPPRFLKPGTYVVTLAIQIPNIKIIEIIENAFQFEISNVDYYLNKERVGIITPVLNWEYESLEAELSTSNSKG